jgi:hypothetical protein
MSFMGTTLRDGKDCFMGYDAVQFGRNLQTFLQNCGEFLLDKMVLLVSAVSTTNPTPEIF